MYSPQEQFVLLIWQPWYLIEHSQGKQNRKQDNYGEYEKNHYWAKTYLTAWNTKTKILDKLGGGNGIERIIAKKSQTQNSIFLKV